MASRTVSVVLTAQVQNYLSNLKAAEDATRQLDARTKTVTESLRAQQQQLQKHNEALKQVGAGMVAVGAVAAAGLALAIKASTDFGAKMAQLQSLSHANAGTMKQLSDAAMTVGTAYGFSATQVADAQIELVKAGVSVQAQLGGALKGALTLAAAGQMDVASATEITTVAMTQFGLSAGQVPHLADLLSAGADKALGSVGDLGEALKNGGLQAHNMGLSIDDTVGTLSAFANAGILGAEAGTQLRSMFLRLQNPTSAAKDELQKYGIAINDSQGKFVGIAKFADELHDKLGGLSDATRNQALATVFGSHAIVGATALYQDGGKAADKAGTSIRDWITAVNDAGFASAQAAGKMNSLQGDTQKLGAAFQTDLIKAGSAATGPLRDIVQGATGVVTALGSMNPAVQGGVMAAGALVAGVGLLGGTFLIAVPKVLAFRDAMTRLEITGGGLARTLGKGGVILAGVTDIVGAFTALGEHGTASTQQISQSAVAISKSWAGLDQTFKSAGSALDSGHGLKASLDELGDGSAFSSAGAAKIFDQLTFGISHLSDVYKSNEANLDAMGQQLAGLSEQDYGKASQSFAQLVQKYHLGGSEISTLLNNMPAYRDELAKQAAAAHVSASDHNLLLIAQGKGAAGAKVLATAQLNAAVAATQQAATLADLSGQATSATTNIDALQKEIEGFGGAQLDARSATRAMYQAIDDATAAVQKNGAGLDVHTQKGRDNQAALDGIATAADNAASKTLKQTGDTAKAAAVMQTGRDAYIKAAEAMGLGAGKAKALADQVGLIPKNIAVAVKVNNYDVAKQQVADLQTKLAALHGKTLTVKLAAEIDMTNSQLKVATMAANGVDYFGNPVKKAGGGSIDGPGPRGVDSVPAILAPGEHVLTTRDVDALGGQGGVYAFRASLAAGAVQRYATGGAVGDAYTSATRYRRQASNDQKALILQKRQAAAAAKAATRAQAAYTKAQDAAANIYGKGTGAKKHDAEVHARNLKKAADRAKKASDTATKRVDDLRTARDTATQHAQTQADRHTNLVQASEDFVSAQRRDPNPDPLSYVDQLRTMSRDTADYGPKRRASFDHAANQYETALVSLSTQSAAAAQKLSDLKGASDQLKTSIASAITGGFQASSTPLTGAHDATTRNVASGWITRNGIRMQNYSTVAVAADPGHVTAGGIASYYTKGAHDAKQFADDLGKLAKRGLNPSLLSEIAGYGVAQGAPIAAALLSGSASQLAQVNRGYAAIGSAANLAGTTVADDNYAKQIAAAQKNADQITKQIAADGEKLRKLIAQAFGLKGYATGTSSAAGGIRWVGEDGPELVGFHGGEAVLNQADSRRWVRGVGGGAGAGGQPIEVHVAPFPDVITIADASGFTAPMRVIAHQVVSRRDDQLAVRVMGAA